MFSQYGMGNGYRNLMGSLKAEHIGLTAPYVRGLFQMLEMVGGTTARTAVQGWTVNRMYIVNDDIPLGCVYEGENGKTKYCPMLNHDDVPYCQYLEDDEAAIGIDERPVYCPIADCPLREVN